jgi:hypothetical protein
MVLTKNEMQSQEYDGDPGKDTACLRLCSSLGMWKTVCMNNTHSGEFKSRKHGRLEIILQTHTEPSAKHANLSGSRGLSITFTKQWLSN